MAITQKSEDARVAALYPNYSNELAAAKKRAAIGNNSSFWGGLSDVGIGIANLAGGPVSSFTGKPIIGENTYTPQTSIGQDLASFDRSIAKGQSFVTPFAIGIGTGVGTGNPQAGLAAYQGTKNLQNMVQGGDIASNSAELAGSAALGFGALKADKNRQAQIESNSNLQKSLDKNSDINSQSQNGYMRNGGVVRHDKINIEKGELEVNPATGGIVREFTDAPKHPKDHSLMNVLGNRFVKQGHAIIPANKASEYKKSGMAARMDIITQLPDTTKLGMAGDGYYDGAPVNLNLNQGNGYYDLNGNAIGGSMPQSTFGQQVNTGNNTFQGFNPTIGYTPKPDVYYNLDGTIGSATNFGNKMEAPKNPSSSDPNNAASTGAAIGSLGGAVAQYYYGKQQQKNAQAMLDNLHKTPYPKYNETIPPELANSYGRAEQMAKQGYSREEIANYQQNVARNLNARMQRAQDIGGGQSSQAIANTLNSNNIQSALGFAGQDAALHRSNISRADSIGQLIANLRNRQENQNIGNEYQYKYNTEQNLGNAISEGRRNQYGAIQSGSQSLGNMAGNAASLYAGGGAGE